MSHTDSAGEYPPVAKPNLDPISGKPGAHPYGTGVGATTGGIAGTLTGLFLGGPAGAVAGAALGAITGGLVGRDIAELFDPTIEREYWRAEYTNRPYHDPAYSAEEYAEAYEFGWKSRAELRPQEWNEVEEELGREWDRNMGHNPMNWDVAKQPVKDAWDRVM